MTNINITTETSSVAPYNELNVAYITLSDLNVRVTETTTGGYSFSLYSPELRSAVTAEGKTQRLGHGGGYPTLSATNFAQAIGEAIIAVAEIAGDPHGDFWTALREEIRAKKDRQAGPSGDLMKPVQ